MWVRSLCQEDPLEEGKATHSSILAWRVPWTEGPGGLQFSPQGRKESDTTEHTHACRFMQRRTHKSVFQILPVMLPIVTYVYKHILKNGTYCSI